MLDDQGELNVITIVLKSRRERPIVESKENKK